MAAKKAEVFDNPLLRAVEFVALAQRKTGDARQTYCMMNNQQLVAFDGVLAASCKITEPLMCCPHTGKLLAALRECKQSYSITQITADQLHITSGDYQAIVPCLTDWSTMQWAWPDPQAGVITENLKAALKIVAPLVNEKAPRIEMASVLVQDQSLIATNGQVVVEALHGITLPPNIILPKAAVLAISKAVKVLTGIGFGQGTATFYFDDGSWMRTQLFLETWPVVSHIFNVQVNPQEVPAGLFEAIAKVAPFSENGKAYCGPTGVSSHSVYKPNVNSSTQTFDNSGMDVSRVYIIPNMKYLAKLGVKAGQTYDHTSRPKTTFFFGKLPVKMGTKKTDVIEVVYRAATVHEFDVPDAPIQTPDNTVQSGYVAMSPQMTQPAQPFTDDDIPF